MVSIRIHSSWEGVENELDRLESLPDTKTKARLDAVLRNAYLATQEDVHVITGSLRGSGNASSDEEERNTWEGVISYGGASPGFPKDPVRYARYEQRRRGEDHDFMRGIHLFHDSFVEAVRESLGDS